MSLELVVGAKLVQPSYVASEMAGHFKSSLLSTDGAWLLTKDLVITLEVSCELLKLSPFLGLDSASWNPTAFSIND